MNKDKIIKEQAETINVLQYRLMLLENFLKEILLENICEHDIKLQKKIRKLLKK